MSVCVHGVKSVRQGCSTRGIIYLLSLETSPPQNLLQPLKSLFFTSIIFVCLYRWSQLYLKQFHDADIWEIPGQKSKALQVRYFLGGEKKERNVFDEYVVNVLCLNCVVKWTVYIILLHPNGLILFRPVLNCTTVPQVCYPITQLLNSVQPLFTVSHSGFSLISN